MWPHAANREENILRNYQTDNIFTRTLENNAALHSTMGLYNRSLHNESKTKISTHNLKKGNMVAHTPTSNDKIKNPLFHTID